MAQNISDKLLNKKWGVFNHYLYHPSSGESDSVWSERVAALDVDAIAKTMADVGAGYYFITLMQGRKFMIAPNATFDSIAGTEPGMACSKRDLPLDLYTALKKYGIDLYLYYTGDGPHLDESEGKKFGFTEPRGAGVKKEFVERWAKVLEEYAVRYGDKVNGWWIDGCYKEYFKYTEELAKPLYDACKKGNPNALVALNDGVKPHIVKDFEYSDMTCGEFNDFTEIPPSRFIDGAQAFILAPLGKSTDGTEWGSWCKPGCKRSKEYMVDYIRKVNAAGGVVTIDIVIDANGKYDPAQIEILKYIGDNL